MSSAEEASVPDSDKKKRSVVRWAIGALLAFVWTAGLAIAGTTLVALEDKDDPDRTLFGVGWGLLGLSYLSAFVLTRWRAIAILDSITMEQFGVDIRDGKEANLLVHRVEVALPLSVATSLIIITTATILFIESRPFDIILGSVMLIGVFLTLLWWFISKTSYDLGVTSLFVQNVFRQVRRTNKSVYHTAQFRAFAASS